MAVGWSLEERISRVVPRARRFLGSNEPGNYLVSVKIPCEQPDVISLADLDLNKDLSVWMDYLLAKAKCLWETNAGLDDDTIPSVCPFFGWAEHSAWLGAEVQLQKDTCVGVPFVKDPDDLKVMENFSNAVHNPWYRYMKEGYDYLRSKKDGSFLLSVRGHACPIDIASSIRGDELFCDFLLNPEFARKLLDFSTKAIAWYYPQLRSWADPVEDGHVFGRTSGGWVGPDCLGHVSIDTAVMCSPEIYREFALPYERELATGYKTVFYHIHNEKMHHIPDMVTIPNIVLVDIANDPKTVPVIENIPEIISKTGTSRLLISGTSEQVRRNIENLGRISAFIEVSCEDRKDAEDIIELMRSRSKI